ncbi:junctophilin-1-like [Penaeus monodon]|uniref:junctophilin-1-like n=1 Tax=Penaeus monodon TaxID=6687 RepID=UPI0018A6DFAC|nr:junctophilin-1-like [Penaeus monodon]
MEMQVDVDGTYKGQWLRGLRHGYGVRTSAQFGQASVSRPRANNRGSTTSLRSDGAGDPLADRDLRSNVDDGRGGFVLRARSDEIPRRRGSLVSDRPSNIRNVFKGLKMRRQRSTGDIQTGRASGSIRSTGSSASWMSTDSGQSAYTVGDVPDEGSNASFIIEDEQLDASVVENYMGEWKNDKRCGFGVSDRTDGLKYEGEWYNNKKYGYGVTTFKDGTKEEGKYKNNVLITSNKKKHVFLIRSAKFRERIEAAVAAAQKAAKIAMQKEDIAISRTATARGKAEQADMYAVHAREDSDIARIFAKQFAPDFHQAGVAAQEAAGSRRTSMNPGGGGMLPDASLMTRGDSLMRGADRGSTPMRLNDRFSHYNRPPSRPPSRDRSVDRFASRGQTPVPPELINPRSRAPSAQRSTAQDWTPDSGVYDDEAAAPAGGSRRPSRPASIISGEAPALTGNGSVGGGFPVPYAIPSSPQEAESLLRKRACGQEIPPCPPTPGQGTVKRTESLYINPIVRRQAQVKTAPAPTLKRKKSLPEVQGLPVNIMSREEAAVLSSAQRHEFRRQAEEAELYRANPLLYLTSPAVQDWFSRQRLVMLILFLNLSLALMFFKLLS